MNLQKKDISILKFLQADSSVSTTSLAEMVNMSQAPCWRRINNLKSDGVIIKEVALLDRKKLGMDVVVFATINLTPSGRQRLDDFERGIAAYPEVIECYTMAGIWDYVLKVVTRDIRHYEEFVRNTLATSPSIRELNSHVVVTEIKNSTELPIETQL